MKKKSLIALLAVASLAQATAKKNPRPWQHLQFLTARQVASV